MPNHTPGPWKADGVDIVADGVWHKIASAGGWRDSSRDIMEERAEQEANARLMAAAPEMLEALESVLHQIEQSTANWLLTLNAMKQAKVIVAKARSS